MTVSRRVWRAVVDLLFPPRCGVCGAGGALLCPACLRRLPPAAPPRCERCWCIASRERCADCTRRSDALDGARAPYVYVEGARALVHGLKYRWLHALAEPMGELLAAYLEAQPLPVDVVVPVPLHRRRRRQRGFNQAELLSRVLAARTGLDLDPRALRRRRNTPHQVGSASRAQREANVRGAFTCSDDVRGRRVLLVDDVQTTGATLRECAASLRAAGAASVWALTFARADDDDDRR